MPHRKLENRRTIELYFFPILINSKWSSTEKKRSFFYHNILLIFNIEICEIMTEKLNMKSDCNRFLLHIVANPNKFCSIHFSPTIRHFHLKLE